MAAWTPPSEADVARYFHRLNNWGRWGADDQKGTLNLITPAKRAAAVALARSGRVVSLARDIAPQPALDYHLLHPLRRGPSRAAIDYVGMIYHGQTVTHLDALCHVEYEGKLYNGWSFDDSVDHGGATWGALDPWFEDSSPAASSWDVAAGRPEGYVAPGRPVTPPDLDAAMARAGVSVEPGDVVVIRSGREAYEASRAPVPAASGQGIPGAPARPGLHIACIEWLRPHDVASDRLGHDGRAPGGVRRAPVRRAPRDPDPGPLPHRRHVSGAPRGRLCGRGTRRVSVHRSAAPDHGQHRLAL
jgi:Putative cyclase